MHVHHGRTACLALALVCLVVSAAAAQTQTQMGDVELSAGLSATMLDVDSLDLDTYRLGLSCGKFVSDTTELLLIGQWVRTEVSVDGESESNTGWEFSGGVAFHQATSSNTVPFFALKAGLWDLGEGVDSEFLWGAAVGLKHYDSEDRYWVVELVYQDMDVEDVSINGLAVNVGMGFRFR